MPGLLKGQCQGKSWASLATESLDLCDGKEEVSLGVDFCLRETKESDTGDFGDGLHSLC